MSGSPVERAREVIAAGANAYVELAGSEVKPEDMWKRYLDADDRSERLACNAFPAALDFAEAVEKAQANNLLNDRGLRAAIRHATEDFNAALLRALPGGGE